MEGGGNVNSLTDNLHFRQGAQNLRQKLGINLNQLLAGTELSHTVSVVCKDNRTV